MSGADRIPVRVVNLTRVSPDPAPPLPAAPLRLSFFDALWIGIPPVRRLLLYRPAPPLPVLLPRLQSSLSCALPLFFPLTGTLAASRDLAIACSPRDSVRFVEAYAEGDLGRLIDDDVHDRAAFRLLVPDLEAGAMAAVQATRFAGGVVIGVAFSHVAADGRAIWDFLRAWAGMCGAAAEGAEVAVSHERSAIVHPFGDRITRQFLDALAPDFPKMLKDDPKIETIVNLLTTTCFQMLKDD